MTPAIQTGAETGPRLTVDDEPRQTDRPDIYLDGTLVLVGCGKAKRDPEDPVDLQAAAVGPDEALRPGANAPTGPAWEARDLYTSTYFQTKREFAELVSAWGRGYDVTPWAVLSAEHAVVPASRTLTPYDTSIDDLGDDPTDPDDWVANNVGRRRPDGEEIVTEVDQWAASVAYSLARWVAGFREERAHPTACDATQLLVLAGQDYIQPLRERGVFEYGIARMTRDPNDGFTLPVEPRFLFEEIDADGFGDQMAWLSDAISLVEDEVREPDETVQQTLAGGGA